MKARGDLMNIRPSAAIRQNYNEIADLCRKSSEPTVSFWMMNWILILNPLTDGRKC